jgi:uncharacterized protein
LDLTAWVMFEIALVGLAAGVLGGLAGVGGSMIMLPALHWLLGDPRASVHHMYMAAAMTVNIAVALPAAWRHNKSGAVRHDLLKPLMLATIVSVIIGVLVGNMVRGDGLRVGLAVFLLCYCAFNIWRLAVKHVETGREHERVGTGNLTFNGGLTGFIGGLLGLGGGVMLVPMLQLLCRVPLKQAIATSSAVIWLSAIVGASLKMGTLSAEGERWQDAVVLVLLLAPTAILGGVLGAALTQKLPTTWVRVAITGLLLVAAARLLKLF